LIGVDGDALANTKGRRAIKRAIASATVHDGWFAGIGLSASDRDISCSIAK